MRKPSIRQLPNVSALPPPASVMVSGARVALTPVSSSNIGAVGYDASARRLVVVFRGGAAYLYHDVPAHLHEELLAAESKGRFLTHFIVRAAPAYRYEKIDLNRAERTDA